jgi:ubiquinone/menaquinone biosynthesis C-methylase UbiE
MTSYDAFARYYDAEISSYTDDVTLYREMAMRTGEPLLELMSGSGRLLLPLAESGLHITGVDVSQCMLDMARVKLDKAGLLEYVTLLQGDVRNIELPNEHFALAFVALNSFMHLEQAKDQLVTLTNVRRALKRDGLLILDVFNPNPCHLSNEDNRLLLDRDFHLDDGQQVFKFVASESDMATQTSNMTCFYECLDTHGHVKRQVVRFSMRWMYRYELEHLLARAGFMLRFIYGSYDLDEYTSDSERLIAVASVAR